MSYQHVRVQTEGQVGIVILHRPEALNALSNGLLRELITALDSFENTDSVGAIVLTGNEKAFAAGADIKAMKDWDYVDVYKSRFITASWEQLSRVRKPIIAAVAMYKPI